MDGADTEWFGYGSLFAMLLWVLFWVLIWCSIWGSVCALISYAKHRSMKTGYLWGFFLGVIGLSVVSLQSAGPRPPQPPSPLPPAPSGMVARRCGRCNAGQNVKVGVERFDCWRCAQGNKV